ncbi:LOW QUALITY PROTEIN: hypothetical protein ACHAW6_000076 [Cyclotella cf. meneghiniana]
MALLEEMREHHFQIICKAPRIYCKAFDNNSGALQLSPKTLTTYKIYPCVSSSFLGTCSEGAHQDLSHRNRKSSC